MQISLFGQTPILEEANMSIIEQASYQNGLVSFKWSVNNPKNFDHFIILRKINSESKYKEIGNILNYSGDGSNEFYFKDDSILEKGTYKYKIRSTNTQINKTEESLTSLSIENTETVNEELFKYIYADPEEKVLNMRLISNVSSKMHGGFYNNKGEVIKEVSDAEIVIGLNEFKFDTSSFDKGNYLLILKIGNENIIEKVNIQS